MTKDKSEQKVAPTKQKSSASTHQRTGLTTFIIAVVLILILAGIGMMFYQFKQTYNILENSPITLGKSSSTNNTSKTIAASDCPTVQCTCDNQRTSLGNDLEMNKYKTILLTKEIKERIDGTHDYTDKLATLKPLLRGKYLDEMSELEKNKTMTILSFEEMVKTIEGTTAPYQAPNIEEKPAEEKPSIPSVKGLFKITKAEEWKVKCNPVVIDKAVQALREKNEWDALQTLEQIEPKNDDMKKVIANLSLRNTLQYYLETIANDALKND